MEKVKIQSIEAKFGKPNAEGICAPFWAVVFADGRKATVWDNQIADYMMKDVGVGGECEVEIKTTPTGYMNVRAVDMETGAKGNNVIAPTPAKAVVVSSRENSIIAQCLTKISFRNCPQPDDADVLKTYRWFLKELDE